MNSLTNLPAADSTGSAPPSAPSSNTPPSVSSSSLFPFLASKPSSYFKLILQDFQGFLQDLQSPFLSHSIEQSQQQPKQTQSKQIQQPQELNSEVSPQTPVQKQASSKPQASSSQTQLQRESSSEKRKSSNSNLQNLQQTKRKSQEEHSSQPQVPPPLNKEQPVKQVQLGQPSQSAAAAVATTAGGGRVRGKPLREQVQQCLSVWVDEIRVAAQEGSLDSFEIYVDLVHNSSTHETKEEAYAWMHHFYKKRYEKTPKHDINLRCKDEVCPRCRALNALDNLMNGPKNGDDF